MKVEEAKQIVSKAIEELSQALENGHSETLKMVIPHESSTEYHLHPVSKEIPLERIFRKIMGWKLTAAEKISFHLKPASHIARGKPKVQVVVTSSFTSAACMVASALFQARRQH